jgi:hypothetical protein
VFKPLGWLWLLSRHLQALGAKPRRKGRIFSRFLTFNKPMFIRSNQAAEVETGNLGL